VEFHSRKTNRRIRKKTRRPSVKKNLGPLVEKTGTCTALRLNNELLIQGSNVVQTKTHHAHMQRTHANKVFDSSFSAEVVLSSEDSGGSSKSRRGAAGDIRGDWVAGLNKPVELCI